MCLEKLPESDDCCWSLRKNGGRNWACVSVCQESGNIGWPRDFLQRHLLAPEIF
jgi:hypothetical protein